MTATAPVVMYGTLFCPYCRAAREFFEGRRVAYEDIRVDHEPALRDEMRARGGGHTVPQIWIGDVHVGGFTDMLALERQGKLEALLHAGADE
jgi:glutaredoxin 3